jgi:hypothetical protein
MLVLTGVVESGLLLYNVSRKLVGAGALGGESNRRKKQKAGVVWVGVAGELV